MFTTTATFILPIDWRVSFLTPIEGWTLVTSGELRPKDSAEDRLPVPRRPRLLPS